MFIYKGYVGEVKIDPDDGVLVGRVLGIRDVVIFEGSTFEEAELEFQNSVDDYLSFCQELGRSASGTFEALLSKPYTNLKIHT